MLPLFKPGQLIVAIPKRVQLGDVVIAQVSDGQVVKRVVDVQDNVTVDLAGLTIHSSSYRGMPMQQILGVVVLPLRVHRRDP